MSSVSKLKTSWVQPRSLRSLARTLPKATFNFKDFMPRHPFGGLHDMVYFTNYHPHIVVAGAWARAPGSFAAKIVLALAIRNLAKMAALTHIARPPLVCHG